MVVAHFIDVGQGNTVLLQFADGTTMLYDCNVTDENAARVLGYLRAVLPRRGIDIFVNSHREADHMRGIKRVHSAFPISCIWDSGVTGGTPGSLEYRDYMEFRRSIHCITVQRWTHCWFGTARIRVLNAKNDFLPDDPNAQSIVLKVENWQGNVLVNSVMLPGDCNATTFERSIIPLYGDEVASTILLAGHHCADNFFCRPDGSLYLNHIRAILPRITVVSVGDNGYGHPAPRALAAYNRYSSGADHVIGADPNLRVLRTDLHGTMRLQLNDNGSWQIVWYGPSPRPAPRSPGRLMPARPSPPAALRPLPGRAPVSGEPNRPVFPSLADILGSAVPPPPRSITDSLPSPEFSELIRALTAKPGPSILPPREPTLADIFGGFLGNPPPDRPFKSGLPFK